jgi:hypothetical protein
MVAAFALHNHLIPSIGAFSSAGQFVYGPQWYWILMSFIALSFGSIFTPWIIQTLLYVFVIYVMFLIGKEIISENFGLLVAFLTAISWAQIGESTNLVSPAIVGILSVFAVYFFVKFIKHSKNLDSFLLGFLIGNTVNIHFQAIGLITLLPVAYLLSKRNLKQLLILSIGFLIPFIPLILFDLRTNFFESKNILDYYQYGQNRLYVPNRWLTYAGVFWPKAWGDIVGGYSIFGYLTIILLTIIALYKIAKQKITKEVLGLVICFGLVFIMLRYYKGVLFGGYLTFLQPFILIFSGIVFYEIYKFKKILFIFLIILVTFTSLFIDIKGIVGATNTIAVTTENLMTPLIKKHPNEKFALFDYKYARSGISLPLSLYLYNRNKIDDNGLRVGIVMATPGALLQFKAFPTIEGMPGGLQLVDLSSKDRQTLINNGWVSVNPSAVYNSVENWYKPKK